MTENLLEILDEVVPSLVLYTTLRELPLLPYGPVDLIDYIEWKEQLAYSLPGLEKITHLPPEDFRFAGFLIQYVQEVADNLRTHPHFLFHQKLPPCELAQCLDISEYDFCQWLRNKCRKWFPPSINS